MIKEILHVGLTVSNLDNSIKFYRDILNLDLQGQMVMEGEETDKLFNMKGIKVNVAYLNGSKNMLCPPVELIEFTNADVEKTSLKLNGISIAELCFKVDNIDEEYKRLKELGVKFISEPQYFDLSSQGFGKSKAVYFYDPDGIILELIEYIDIT